MLVIGMVRKGIPDYFRGYLWRYSWSSKERRDFPTLYRGILKVCDVKQCHVEQMRKDIRRLAPVRTGLEVERSPWYAGGNVGKSGWKTFSRPSPLGSPNSATSKAWP